MLKAVALVQELSLALEISAFLLPAMYISICHPVVTDEEALHDSD